MKCIYCLEDKPKDNFTHIEHVVSKLLGTFTDNNFTLNRQGENEAVCNTCNQQFGDELELFLGRDSIEGFLRYKYRVRDPKQFKNILGRRLKIRWPQGEIQGAQYLISC